MTSKMKVKYVSDKVLHDYDGMNSETAKVMGFRMPRDTIYVSQDSKRKNKTLRHERHEMRLMKQGVQYWPAHLSALRAEMRNPKLSSVSHNLSVLQGIVEHKQHAQLKFRGEGAVRIDLYTASALLEIYKNLNDTSKEKFCRMLETKLGTSRLIGFAWKHLKNPGRTYHVNKAMKFRILHNKAINKGEQKLAEEYRIRAVDQEIDADESRELGMTNPLTYVSPKAKISPKNTILAKVYLTCQQCANSIPILEVPGENFYENKGIKCTKCGGKVLAFEDVYRADRMGRILD